MERRNLLPDWSHSSEDNKGKKTKLPLRQLLIIFKKIFIYVVKYLLESFTKFIKYKIYYHHAVHAYENEIIVSSF